MTLNFDPLKYFWYAVQGIIDHKTLLFVLTLPIVILLLGLIVYYTLPRASLWGVFTSSRFLVMTLAVVLLWVVIAYVVTRPVAPPQDNNFYVALSSLNSMTMPEAEILLSAIKDEFRRYSNIAPKLRVQESFIEETISDFATATRRGKQRGVHEVIFGNIKRVPSSNNVIVRIGMGQAWPFSPSHNNGEYTIEKSLNYTDTHEVRSLAREVTIKVLKIMYSSTMPSQIVAQSMSSMTLSGQSFPHVYNVGSNLSWAYTATENGQKFFILAQMDAMGNPRVWVRLRDSDGKNVVEIKDNTLIQGKDHFTVSKSGPYFLIRDSYERPIFEISPQAEVEAFKEEYLRRLDELGMGLTLPKDIDPVANDHDILLQARRERIEEIKPIKKISRITAEVYADDGTPRLLIDSENVMKFQPLQGQ